MIKGKRKRGFTMRQVKWGIRRYVYLLLVLCLCFSQAIFAQAASAQTEDARTVRVAFLLKAEGIDENIIFPAHSYGTVYTTLIALEGSNLREDNAASKNPLVVGLWKQAKTRNSEVQSYLDTENFDYQLQYYDTHEEQYQALADGTVDVISNVSLSPIQGTRIIEKFAPRAYYFASSSKNEQLLKQLDETISIIGQVQPSLQDVLFDKFLRNTRYIFHLQTVKRNTLLPLKL